MDSHTVNLQQAKTQLPRLLDLAHGGEEILAEEAEKPYPIDSFNPKAIPSPTRRFSWSDQW